MVAPRKALSLEEFLRLPEEKPALEYEDGRITQKVSPKARHAMLQITLGELINTFARPRKLALAFSELRVNLGGRSWVPDISVFRWERIQRTADGTLIDDVFVAPDIAAEIASPGQSKATLAQRAARYLPHGTHSVLGIDPDDRTVVVYRPDTLPRTVVGDERIDLDDVLPGFQLTAAELFAALQIR
jgi:Uma2 family endonuclease